MQLTENAFESVEMRAFLRKHPQVQDTVDLLADYSLGLVEGPEDDPCLLGSGTLVSIGEIRGILTAEHVLDALPQHGPVGLAMPTRFGPYLGRPKIHMEYLTRVPLGRGKNIAEGPDLGLLVLPDRVRIAIPSTKTFFNLSKRRDRVLENPASFEVGIWALTGAAGEWTMDGTAEAGFRRVRDFRGGPAFCFLDCELTVGGFDYLEFTAEYGGSSESPGSFGGFSGGGLWHILYEQTSDQLIVNDLILSGVAFFQSDLRDSKRIIRCHGRRSIYQNLIDEVMRV